MKNLFTKTILLGGLAGSLVLGGCKDNQKYEDFADFVKDKGKNEIVKERYDLMFLRNNKQYDISYWINPEEAIVINVHNEKSGVTETFEDNNLDGVDYCVLIYDKITDGEPSKENKEKYENLIDSLPKWYAESKKAKTEQKSEKKLTELEKYNLENKQVYEDFSTFIKLKGDSYFLDKTYEIKGDEHLLRYNKSINEVSMGIKYY